MAGPLYIHKPDHRNGSPLKSQWTISQEDELRCFQTSSMSGWSDELGHWGLHVPAAAPVFVGRTAKATGREINVKLCRFLIDPSQNAHGYPADYRKRSQDTPAALTLAKWYAAGLIAKHEVARVLKGKPCSLSD